MHPRQQPSQRGTLDVNANLDDIAAQVFEKCDLDESGALDRQEFREVVCRDGQRLDVRHSMEAWPFSQLAQSGPRSSASCGKLRPTVRRCSWLSRRSPL